MTTHNGHKWEVGIEQVINKPGNRLCSDQVFHFYDSPEIAVLMNPAHANIDKPILWEVDCNEVAHDGAKGGAKRMTLVKKIKAPKFTTLQKQVFAIKCAMAVYKEKTFVAWAKDFISGDDRTKKSAYAAADAADAAADAAAYAVYAVDVTVVTYAAAYAASYAAAVKIRKSINSAAKFAANFKG